MTHHLAAAAAAAAGAGADAAAAAAAGAGADAAAGGSCGTTTGGGAGAVDSITTTTAVVAVLAVDGCPTLSHVPHALVPVAVVSEFLQRQGRLVEASYIVPEERFPQVADGLLCILNTTTTF